MLLSALLASFVAANPYLDDGIRLYESQRFEEAAKALQLAADVKDAPAAERRKTFELLAKSQIALGKTAEADEAFARLLSADPQAEEPSGAPKVKESFRRAKQRLYKDDYVAMKAVTAPEGEVWIEAIDPWHLLSAVEIHELKGAMDAVQLMKFDGLYRGRLDLATLRYFVLGRASDGTVLASVGSEKVPLERTLPPSLVSNQQQTERRAEQPKITLTKSRIAALVTGGVSAILLATAIGLRVSAENDASAARMAVYSSERFELDNMAQSKAIGSNVVFGFAAAGAATTAVLIWAF
jgi:tetratricopeptide (TPR) repeat protein